LQATDFHIFWWADFGDNIRILIQCSARFHDLYTDGFVICIRKTCSSARPCFDHTFVAKFL